MLSGKLHGEGSLLMPVTSASRAACLRVLTVRVSRQLCSQELVQVFIFSTDALWGAAGRAVSVSPGGVVRRLLRECGKSFCCALW